MLRALFVATVSSTAVALASPAAQSQAAQSQAAQSQAAQSQAAQSAQSAQPVGCEDAAVRISTNTLPRVGATQWNDWVRLTGCGTRGAAVIASALRSDGIRGETELTRLDHITNLLDGWFQPSLISAYQALLRAPNASYSMRLRAMWLLSGLYAPNVDVAGPLQGYMSARCESYERMTSLRDAPATLPASAYDQARDAIAYVASDGAAPEYVRATARCWAGVRAASSTIRQAAARWLPSTRWCARIRSIAFGLTP